MVCNIPMRDVSNFHSCERKDDGGPRTTSFTLVGSAKTSRMYSGGCRLCSMVGVWLGRLLSPYHLDRINRQCTVGQTIQIHALFISRNRCPSISWARTSCRFTGSQPSGRQG